MLLLCRGMTTCTCAGNCVCTWNGERQCRYGGCPWAAGEWTQEASALEARMPGCINSRGGKGAKRLQGLVEHRVAKCACLPSEPLPVDVRYVPKAHTTNVASRWRNAPPTPPPPHPDATMTGTSATNSRGGTKRRTRRSASRTEDKGKEAALG